MKKEPKPPIRITMSAPDITEEERKAVAEVLKTPNLSMGPRILAFEESIREYVGAKYAIGVNSGTAGLHLAIRAVGVRDGDLVITTPFSFVASTNVILFERAIPILIDVDPNTGNMDPHMLKEAIEDITAGGERKKRWFPRKGANENGVLKAILPVDVFGQPADLNAILEVANAHNLPVIEDSCEALGAKYLNRHAGTLGDIGVYAFYPNKQITTGEGGMVVTNNAQYAEVIRALRNQGRQPGDTWLSHTLLGYNYRMDEMSAALGLAQMKRIEELLEKRQRVADWYKDRLKATSEIELPHIAATTTRMSWFVYVIRLAPHINRDEFATLLKERNIPVRPYFVPIHLQPYMVERFGYKAGDFPVTEDLGSRGLALPFSSVMTEEQVEYVCQNIIEIIGVQSK